MRATNQVVTPLLDNLLIADGQCVESLIWANAQELHANTATSVHHANRITLSFDVQETGVDPLSKPALRVPTITHF